MSTCRSCAASIVWATPDNGRAIPLDPDAVPDGNLVDVVPGAPLRRVTHVQPNALLIDDPPRYVSHFVTCPNADQHRKDHTA